MTAATLIEHTPTRTRHTRRLAGWGVLGVREPDSGCEPCGVSLWYYMHLVVLGVLSPRPISTSPLHPLRGFHARPINPVVCWGPYPLKGVGVLILKPASRLDAFSGYPSRT
jgi:hypothetical protein